jgi:hypothetical protein
MTLDMRGPLLSNRTEAEFDCDFVNTGKASASATLATTRQSRDLLEHLGRRRDELSGELAGPIRTTSAPNPVAIAVRKTRGSRPRSMAHLPSPSSASGPFDRPDTRLQSIVAANAKIFIEAHDPAGGAN